MRQCRKHVSKFMVNSLTHLRDIGVHFCDEASLDDILELCRRFRVLSVAFDPWNATQLAQRLASQGVSTDELRMNTANLSEPCNELDAATFAKARTLTLLLRGRLRRSHDRRRVQLFQRTSRRVLH